MADYEEDENPDIMGGSSYPTLRGFDDYNHDQDDEDDYNHDDFDDQEDYNLGDSKTGNYGNQLPKIRFKGAAGSSNASNESLKKPSKKSENAKSAQLEKGMPPPGIQSGGIEPEAHFVLRAFPAIATRIHERLKEEKLEEVLSIMFLEDKRTAMVVFEGQQYRGRLVDLPCIIESHKTFDSKQFYKIADVSQMLVLEDPDVEQARKEAEEAAAVAAGEAEAAAAAEAAALGEYYEPLPVPEPKPKSTLWKHGLAPPMRNVRKRRFRKRASKHIIEDVEYEVQKLLEADEEADNVKTTIEYIEEEGNENESKQGTQTTQKTVTLFEEELEDGEGDIDNVQGLNAEERKELGLERAEVLEDSDESESEDDDDDAEGEGEGEGLGELGEFQPMELDQDGTGNGFSDGEQENEEEEDGRQKDRDIENQLGGASDSDQDFESRESEPPAPVSKEDEQLGWLRMFEKQKAQKQKVNELEDKVRATMERIDNCPNQILKRRIEAQLKEIMIEKDNAVTELLRIEETMQNMRREE